MTGAFCLNAGLRGTMTVQFANGRTAVRVLGSASLRADAADHRRASSRASDSKTFPEYSTTRMLRARERVLFIGTQFSILYTFMYSPA
jgi:hypothetical protein